MQKNFVSGALTLIDSLNKLLSVFEDLGATRVLAKPLAANDNSKNQVYLGGGFGALNIIPHSEITTDETIIAGRQSTAEPLWMSKVRSISSSPNSTRLLDNGSQRKSEY